MSKYTISKNKKPLRWIKNAYENKLAFGYLLQRKRKKRNENVASPTIPVLAFLFENDDVFSFENDDVFLFED